MGKWLAFVNQLRVDPTLFLYCFAAYMTNPGASNLFLQKTCYPDAPPDINAICTNSSALKESAILSSTRATIKEFFPGIIVLLAGSWRDHTGRSKPLLIMAHFGEMLAVVIMLVSSQIWSLTIWGTILSASFIGSMSGSRVLVTMACLTYVVDRTTDEQRTSRLSIMITASIGGIAMANFFGGFLLQIIGYLYFFILVLIVYSISIFLTFILVEDTKRPPTSNRGGAFQSLKRYKLLLAERPNKRIIWIVMLCSCLLNAELYSEGAVALFYLQKILGFTPRDVGFVGGYKLVLSLVTAGFVTPILKNVFKLTDFNVAIICCIPSIISCYGMGLVQSHAQVYIFATLDLMRIVLISTLWAILTKCVHKNELGVYSSIMTFGEAVMPIITNPLYAFIFNKTIDTLPGAFYFVSGTSDFLVLTLISYCSYKMIPIPEKQPTEEEEGKNMDVLIAPTDGGPL